MTPSEAHEDRRREARLSPGDVECEIEGARFVHVLGLSVEGHGMRVMTDRPLPPKQPLPIRLELTPDEILDLTGEVVWGKDENFEFTHRYISGVHFIDPAPAVCRRLHEFVEQYIEQDGMDGHREQKADAGH